MSNSQSATASSSSDREESDRLVAKRLPLQHSRMAVHPTMGHRVWWAWKCLPVDERGESPDWRDLERKVGLANGTLYKLCWGVTTRPSFETLEKAARALETTPEWLMREEGHGPVSNWPVRERPDPPEGAAKRSKHRRKSGQIPAVKESKG